MYIVIITRILYYYNKEHVKLNLHTLVVDAFTDVHVLCYAYA